MSDLSLCHRRRCRRLFSTPVRAWALNQLVREKSLKSEAASMRLLYLCVLYWWHTFRYTCDFVHVCAFKPACIYNLYTGAHQTLFFRQRNTVIQMKITSQQRVKLKSKTGGEFVRWEFLVQKERRRNIRGWKRFILMPFRKEKERNRFQSPSTLSLTKYVEKSLMGRNETELQFHCCFMDS